MEKVFTPGQRHEALSWLKKECSELYSHIEEATDGVLATNIVDMYFKLKGFDFKIKPNQFIFGIEYQDAEKIANGTEPVNLAIHNPKRDVPHDALAFQILVELVNRLKVG